MMWKNVVDLYKPQMTIWCMCIAHWIPKATNPHPQNIFYLMLFYCYNSCTNVLQC